MLKSFFNECTFMLTITPVDPILIKSGHATVSGPDMTPVRTQRHGQPEVFLPGSSLKGVFRSHVERIVRTLNPTEGVVCLPYQDARKQQDGKPIAEGYAQVFCGHKFRIRHGWPMKENLSNEQVYLDSCPACRLFGSTDFIGRIAISDAYSPNPEKVKIERRDGVGIDRFTGGAAHGAKFELEVVTSGAFETSVHLRNFEIWQLGMLAAILQDFQDDLIWLGSGKSRGLGKAHGEISAFTIAFLKPAVKDKMPATEIWGLGKFLGNGAYGTDPEDVLSLNTPLTPEENGIRMVIPLEGELLHDVLRTAAQAFSDKMAAWTIPNTMTFAHIENNWR